MNRWALFAGIFAGIFVPMMIFAFALFGKQWREEQDKARERRMAEHRMNARLLRLDI